MATPPLQELKTSVKDRNAECGARVERRLPGVFTFLVEVT